VAITDELRAHRESLVVRHIQAETDNDTETALQTFTRPKYDLRGTSGGIVEGTDAVRELIAGFGTSLPSVAYVAEALHHADDAVIVEYRITGSHDAEWKGIAPTGNTLDYPAIAVFEFDGPDLVCERLYINVRGLEEQMTGLVASGTAG